MCGIVGLITKKLGGFYHTDLQRFQALLINDTQRGEDSTGAFVVNKDGGARSIKIASNPFNLFACKEWDTFRSTAIQTGRILVGHNRKATQGAINSENAHPFSEGKIVLVHNGTLRNHAKFGTGKTVDSHAIACAFNEGSHEEILSQIEGAFAFVWYNLETEKLYMIRNAERPLWLVTAGDTLAFASEAWMAAGQFVRENETVTNISPLPEGVLYEFSLDGTCATKALELYKAPPLIQQSQNYSNPYRHGHWNEEWQESLENVSAITRDVVTEDQRVVIPFKKGPYLVNETLQVKINRINRELNPRTNTIRYKAYGVTQEILKPVWDIVAWLPLETQASDLEQWLTGPTTACVETVHDNLVAGASLWMNSLDLDKPVETYTSTIGSWTWCKIVDTECCTKCATTITYDDAAFTSVNIKKNDLRIVCSKCVANSLPVGDMRNGFIKRRFAAVQNRQLVGQEPRSRVEYPIEGPCPSSLH